jgi:hypothetical protein
MTESSIIAHAALTKAKAAQAASAAPAWSAISGKPATFPPSSHTHDLDSLNTGGYSGNVTLGEVTLVFDKGVLTAAMG